MNRELCDSGGGTLYMLISAMIDCAAQITSQIIAQTTPIQVENGFDAAPAIFLVAVAGVCVMALMAAGAAVAGLFCAAVVIAMIIVAVMAVMAMMAAAAAISHLLFAIIIWSHRPPTRVFMDLRWWGVITLAFGIFSAIAFFVLHYRSGAKPRCYNCGYSLGGLGKVHVCPECGNARVQVLRAIGTNS